MVYNKGRLSSSRAVRTKVVLTIIPIMIGMDIPQARIRDRVLELKTSGLFMSASFGLLNKNRRETPTYPALRY